MNVLKETFCDFIRKLCLISPVPLVIAIFCKYNNIYTKMDQKVFSEVFVFPGHDSEGRMRIDPLPFGSSSPLATQQWVWTIECFQKYSSISNKRAWFIHYKTSIVTQGHMRGECESGDEGLNIFKYSQMRY